MTAEIRFGPESSVATKEKEGYESYHRLTSPTESQKFRINVIPIISNIMFENKDDKITFKGRIFCPDKSKPHWKTKEIP